MSPATLAKAKATLQRRGWAVFKTAERSDRGGPLWAAIWWDTAPGSGHGWRTDFMAETQADAWRLLAVACLGVKP